MITDGQATPLDASVTIQISQLSLQLVREHLRRRQRARRLDIPFRRRGTFRLPAHIFVGGRNIPLNLLDEQGTHADFLGIFLNNMYMVEALKGMGSVVDIGANQGLFSIYARMLYPAATIHAYEPNPLLSDRLASHCEPIDVEVFQEAVGLSEGRCDLQIEGDSNLTRAISSQVGDIPVVGIGRVLERMGGELDLLKIDCEGFEWDILQDRPALGHVRYITMEYHCWANNSDHQKVASILRKLGFVVLKQQPATTFGQILARRSDVN